jgi:hypothetical protein
VQFGSTNGSTQFTKSNRFRIVSASYGPGNASITATPCADFTDFNAIWTGLDFADFTAVALNPATYPSDALKFNEFSIIPLMGA